MSTQKQLVQSTLSQDAFYQVNKKIFRDLKDANAAVLLTSLISKYSYFENRGELNSDNSFFNTKEMLTEELFLHYKVILKLEKLLEEKGYIKTYSKGMPKKKHFIINWDFISEVLSSDSAQAVRDSQNGRTLEPNKPRATAKMAVRNSQNGPTNENKLITIKDNNNKGNDGETLDTLDIEIPTKKSNNKIYNYTKTENYDSKGEELIRKLQIEGGFDSEIFEIRDLIAKGKFGESEYQEYFDLIW